MSSRSAWYIEQPGARVITLRNHHHQAWYFKLSQTSKAIPKQGTVAERQGRLVRRSTVSMGAWRTVWPHGAPYDPGSHDSSIKHPAAKPHCSFCHCSCLSDPGFWLENWYNSYRTRLGSSLSPWPSREPRLVSWWRDQGYVSGCCCLLSTAFCSFSFHNNT